MGDHGEKSLRRVAPQRNGHGSLAISDGLNRIKKDVVFLGIESAAILGPLLELQACVRFREFQFSCVVTTVGRNALLRCV